MDAMLENTPLPSPPDDREGRYTGSVLFSTRSDRIVRAELRLDVNGKLARHDFADVDVRAAIVAVTGAEVVIASLYLKCIAGCGLGHLIKEILACRRAGNDSVEDVIKCLRAKLGSLGEDLIACAGGCLITV